MNLKRRIQRSKSLSHTLPLPPLISTTTTTIHPFSLPPFSSSFADKYRGLEGETSRVNGSPYYSPFPPLAPPCPPPPLSLLPAPFQRCLSPPSIVFVTILTFPRIRGPALLSLVFEEDVLQSVSSSSSSRLWCKVLFPILKFVLHLLCLSSHLCFKNGT